MSKCQNDAPLLSFCSNQVVNVDLPDFCINFQHASGKYAEAVIFGAVQPRFCIVWGKKTHEYKIPFLRIKCCETEALSLIMLIIEQVSIII